MLSGKTLLITGSSRGIGAATARLAKERGAEVILHGRSPSPQLSKLARDLRATSIVCDVGQQNDVQTCVQEVTKQHPQIDGLINCAGIVQPKPFLDLTDEDWLAEYRVNVLGTIHFCQAIIPFMQKQKHGRIVNIASIRGLGAMTSARGMSYSSSKAAIINITASLAKEFSPIIAVNAIAPGFTETDMSRTWTDGVWKQVKSSLLGRAAKPSEIAEAILFLVSDRASFISGQTLLVDGGYSISEK